MSNNQLIERITELESRVTFQEDVIEQLNNELVQQQLELTKFRSALKIIDETIKNQGLPTNDSEKPPHY